MPTFDERDKEILAKRQAEFLACQEIKAGDFVRFCDGTIRRVSYVWDDESGTPEHIQTASEYGGSFYLGDGGYMSYSGSLFFGVSASTFRRTTEIRPGQAWFFHHDWAQAHNGVYFNANCPVWECSILPTDY